MKDEFGNLLTNKKEILDATVKHYTNVLRNRPIKDDLQNHQTEREELATKRMELASKNVTPDWDMEELEVVLKYLKKNKSKDALGYIYELFRPEVCGEDLKLAILKMMSLIKQKQEFPECLELCNISSIFKRKGNKNEFGQYRGIFRVLIFRAILERLIYNDEYSIIDQNLTDSNVGACKNRNIRDNLFVVTAILNSVKKGSEEAVDMCAYDVEKCFIALWTFECINDLFEAGLQNNKLTLLFKININAQVAVKTTQGMTDRVNIGNMIMQGTL